MSNSYFSFKQFTINQEKAAFKVGTDGVLLGAAAATGGANRILDIGSGTGLIAIMLAQRCDARITAIEPDDESYFQCLENVNLCKWSERISVEHTDLQNFQPADSFDLANKIENIHHTLYKDALGTLGQGDNTDIKPFYVCQYCGNTVEGEAPDKCRICGMSKKMFKQIE